MKQCTTCHQLLPLQAFYWRKSGRKRDGPAYAYPPCKLCWRARVKARVNTAEGKAKDQAWRSSPRGKESLRKHEQSTKGKERIRRYQQSPKGRVASHRGSHNRRSRLTADERRQIQIGKTAYYIEHKLELQAYKKAYYIRHREKVKARSRSYYTVHREETRVRAKAYYSAHLEKFRVNNARRKARQQDLPATLTITEWEAIKAAYGYKCAYCGTRPRHLTQDHVLPLSKGGGTVMQNIVPACKSCNSQKYTNLPVQPVKLVLV